MSYRTYQTKAFVLHREPHGEHSERLTFLTRDLGLISALAQGVRKEKSKLRFSLQPFSHTSVVLVRGRETWRVIGAQEAEHPWISFRGESAKLALLARLFGLCRRMLHGEEKNEYLFDALASCLSFLMEAPTTSTSASLLAVEVGTAARILHSLGYFANEDRYQGLFSTTHFSSDLVLSLEIEKPKLLKAINTSLKASHL